MITNPVAPILNNAAGLGTFIGNLIAMGIIIASILVLLYFVIGGIEWITSAGDKAALESARNRLTNALIGLVIVVASWAIMTVVSTFLGLSFPCLPIPTLDGIKSTCSPSGSGGGVCKDKAGKDGQACSNLNKCDINGGCNPACCSGDGDCNGQKCTTANGFCSKSGKSCTPGTSSKKANGQSCSSWDECQSSACDYGTCKACSDFNTDPARCSSHAYGCKYLSNCYFNQGQVCCVAK